MYNTQAKPRPGRVSWGDFVMLALFSGMLALFVAGASSLSTADRPPERTDVLPESRHAAGIQFAGITAETCLNTAMRDMLFYPGTPQLRTRGDLLTGKQAIMAIEMCGLDFEKALPADLRGSKWALARWELVKSLHLPAAYR